MMSYVPVVPPRPIPARATVHAALLPVLACLSLPGLARAADPVDPVLFWNQQSYLAAATAGGPPIQARINAITHLAIHDALNSIEARYQPYAGYQRALPGASPQAAIAAAAYETLKVTIPAKAQALRQDSYDPYIAALRQAGCPQAYPTCIDDGVALGAAAAAAILALRADDGSATPHATYVPASMDPGVYQPTPGSPPPQFGAWGKVRTFALNHSRQFRPQSPLRDLTGESYVRDYLEVHAEGSAAVRNAALAGNDPVEKSKSESTPFWARSGGNVNALVRAVVEARETATGRRLDAWQHARLFALVNMAQADASIALFDAKYDEAFWRPITAIHATEDPAWTTYLSPTPPYPDYPSGLSSLVGSATEVLRQYFGTDALPFSMRSTTFAGVPFSRGFGTLTEAQNDAAMSRVYGGIHFRSACLDGIDLGNKVGRYVFRHYLKPL